MEVILSNFENHPSCPHGPCLLFERYTSNKSKTGRKFFACSACRDRSECSFFQWADDARSEKSKTLWQKLIQEKSPPFSHDECMKRLDIFKKLPDVKKKYCKTCSLLIINKSEMHPNHIIEHVSSDHLVNPSLLFEIHENKKVEAQYFFNNSTINFIVSLISDLGFSKVLSIGAPKIHEFVISNQDKGLSSFFMDIDHRYMQFFSPEQFCRYNIFNNYFFDGKESEKKLKKFLSQDQNQKIVIVLDPPYGGLVDAISHTLKNINEWWQKENNKTDEEFIPIMWIFPYFQEGRILKNFPFMKMMDYKVEYENHTKFRKSNTKNSPARIFTNIEASSFVLPSELGYRLCNKCMRYVSEENEHCATCNSCTTKHGKTYHHCDHCQQCVKSSFAHCEKCNTCHLSSANGGQNCVSQNSENGQEILEKCTKCKGVGHRKRNCPGVSLKNIKKRKRK